MGRLERARRALTAVPMIYLVAVRYVAAGMFVAATFPLVAVAVVVLSDRLSLLLQERWNETAERITGEGR